jgi:hypothetical protein
MAHMIEEHAHALAPSELEGRNQVAVPGDDDYDLHQLPERPFGDWLSYIWNPGRGP